jgi:hypothetical protein
MLEIISYFFLGFLLFFLMFMMPESLAPILATFGLESLRHSPTMRWVTFMKSFDLSRLLRCQNISEFLHGLPESMIALFIAVYQQRRTLL